MNEHFVWKIDHAYRDMGVKAKGAGYSSDDEFGGKICVDAAQQWGIANSGGIRKLSSGNGGRKNKNAMPAAIFLISSQITTAFHNPWNDAIDEMSGTVTYWGDAKWKKDHDVDSWDGNIMLARMQDAILDGRYSQVPPLLYFIKERSGQVTFKGLCVIDSIEKTWFIDQSNRVKNYRCKLAILDCEKVDPSWLVHRAQNNNDDPDDDRVPAAWRNYVKSGEMYRLLAWRNKILTREQQLPDPSGPGSRLLDQLMKIDPFVFEKKICSLLQNSRIVHRILQTRNVKDGGFDMEGEFLLPSPFKYPIRFKGEVKRRETSVGPKEVSRLVARLGRGEYGLFFTTGYYTRAAQEEVINDAYPVRLISGADLYSYYYAAKLINEHGEIVL